MSFSEDQESGHQRKHAEESTIQVSHRHWRNPSYHYRSHKKQILIQRIEMIQFDKLNGNNGFRIENRGKKIQDGNHNSPQKLYITEINHYRRQNQADPDAEEDQIKNHDR